MDTLRALASVRGLDIAREAFARAKKETSNAAALIAAELPVTVHQAEQWVKWGKSWFGPLEDTDERDKRDRAGRIAENFSMAQIEIITAAVNQVTKRASKSREDIRLELSTLAGTCSCDTLKERARILVGEANGEATKAERFCAFSTRTDARGCKTMTLRGEETIISQIADAMQAAAYPAKKRNKKLTINQAMADVVINRLLLASGEDGAPLPHQPALIAVLDKYEYCDGGKLVDSFGTVFSLEEAANLIMADTGWLVIADKNADLVANFNIKNRYATENQRMAAVIEQITCAVPGCTKLTKDSQIHHIHAYSRGGPTIQSNLTGLCPVHNGRNDDNPGRARNGRIARSPATKRAGWKPPGWDKLLVNDGPLADNDGRALINRALKRARE